MCVSPDNREVNLPVGNGPYCVFQSKEETISGEVSGVYLPDCPSEGDASCGLEDSVPAAPAAACLLLRG